MTSPDERAGNDDRNAAIKLVEDALKTGRIVQADHDMRIDQLKGAQTMQDIDLQVRDLRAPGPSTPPTIAPVPATPPGSSTAPPSATAGGQPWPLVNYGPASHDVTEIATAVGKGGKALGGIIAVIVLVAVVVPIAGAVIAFFSARDSFPDFDDLGPTDDTTYLPGQAPGEDGVNVLTVEGFNDLVDAVRDETGGTFTFTTVMYPRYAVVEMPTGVNQRYQSFYWDGDTLELQDIKGSSSDDAFDLSLVDPDQMIEMLTTVRDRLDEPTSWYVVVTDNPTQDTQISAYASNEFSESTYLIETLDGTVVYDSEDHQ